MENDDIIPTLVDETTVSPSKVPVTILTGYLGMLLFFFLPISSYHNYPFLLRCGEDNFIELHSH